MKSQRIRVDRAVKEDIDTITESIISERIALIDESVEDMDLETARETIRRMQRHTALLDHHFERLFMYIDRVGWSLGERDCKTPYEKHTHIKTII